jgi:two-component system nitrate/nitrite response regulator NarL
MRLVLCDDHRLLLQALATALAGRGYAVEAVTTTPDEAVRAVERYDPDVLLTDLCFPDGGSGIEAARQVRAGHPRTKVVVITGSDDASLLTEALAVGVSGYVVKGERIEAICQALDVADRGEITLHGSLVRKLGSMGALPPQRAPHRGLTPREQHILDLLTRGLETHQIVRELGVSQSTVRTHIQNILSKLGVHTRLEAVVALGQPTHRVEETPRVDGA